MNIIMVMVGGFFGAILRYMLGEWLVITNGFPIGTLTVNLIGCFLLGWTLTSSALTKKWNPKLILFLGTGFIGSFTTFSTFTVEVIHLLEKKMYVYAALYIFLSNFVGILLAFAGYKIGHVRTRKRGGVA
ncbi:fluoride efflux transporter CrcB [Fredinandcohnia humi]